MPRSLLFLLPLAVLVFAPRLVAAQPLCLADADCADGDLCNGVERCEAGTCVPAPPLVCDDDDPCTTDLCNATAGCGHVDDGCPATCGPGDDGLRCSDGTACTVGDVCASGVCVGTPLACDDADPCTVDTCNATLGCTYAEQPNPPGCVTTSDCNFAADHQPCVADGDPCTQDGCLLGGCVVGLLQQVRQCDDADACNGREFCSSVKGCEPGSPPVCDDGAACNGTESCVPASGCVAGTPAPDGTPCDDGRLCTTGDACASATCVGSPRVCDDADPATTDLCTEATGCLACAPLAAGRIGLTVPTGARPGTFTARGSFAPSGPFAPGADGADLLLHDGATVFQASHVPAASFVASPNGRTERYTDRSGAAAAGLQRLAITTRPGRPTSWRAKGLPAGPTFGGNASSSVTLVAGSSCATATLACTVNGTGTTRRCR